MQTISHTTIEIKKSFTDQNNLDGQLLHREEPRSPLRQQVARGHGHCLADHVASRWASPRLLDHCDVEALGLRIGHGRDIETATEGVASKAGLVDVPGKLWLELLCGTRISQECLRSTEEKTQTLTSQAGDSGRIHSMVPMGITCLRVVMASR